MKIFLLALFVAIAMLMIPLETKAEQDQTVESTLLWMQKQSRYGIPGSKQNISGNESALSVATEYSIQTNLAKEAGIDAQSIRILKLGDTVLQQKLQERFGPNIISCKLTVRPNGRIASVVITKSSGSDETDRKVLEFVRAAGPFLPHQFPKPLSWFIDFPNFRVSPDWCLHSGPNL